MITTWLRELRHALRALWQDPGFAIVAVASLAIGIGATTAVFSLVSAVYMRPAEFPDEASLVDVHEESDTRLCAGCGVGTSLDGFRDWQAEARSFSAMAAYTEIPFVVGGDEMPVRVTGALASANLFTVLGVRPVQGRMFTAGEDRVGAERVVVISAALWRRVSGERSPIGASVRLNGEPYTVIGVMASGFGFPDRAALWVPLAAHAGPGTRASREYGVAARLSPGVTLAQADAEMRTLAARLATLYPEQAEWTAGVTSFADDRDAEVGPYFWVLQGAVLLVLLIACANLAGLLLVRASGRSREMAIRLSLGGSRARLIVQLLTETMILATIGGGVGLALARWGVDLAVAGIAAEAPYYIRFGLDGRVVAFCLAVTLLTGLMVGILPALRATAAGPHDALRESAWTASASRRQARVRAILVVSEMALALVLLAASGLMIKTFLRLNRPAVPRAVANRVLMSQLTLLDRRFDDPAQRRAIVEEAVARVAARTGGRAAVEHVSFLAGFGATDRVIRADGVASVPAGASPRFAWHVTPDWFAIMGAELVAGRPFTEQDGRATTVAIVNQAMARSIWGTDGAALGARLRLDPDNPDAAWLTVVGVISDGGEEPADGLRPASRIWLPWVQSPGHSATLLVRAERDPLTLVSAIRDELAQLGPDIPVQDVRSLTTDLRRQYWPVRFYAVVLSAFAGFAVLLAAIGVWGIIAYAVSLRTREIGIRMALGARAEQVLFLITAQGVRLVATALALGLAGAVASTRVIGAMLFGTSPLDPAVFIAVSLLFVTIALVAVVLPARRATRVDPLITLRAE